MSLEIKDLRRERSGAMYIAPERICVTADGRVTDEKDPEAVRLLVGKGCEIPADEAARYGLISGVSTEPESEPEPEAEAGEESAAAAGAEDAPVSGLGDTESTSEPNEEPKGRPTRRSR